MYSGTSIFQSFYKSNFISDPDHLLELRFTCLFISVYEIFICQIFLYVKVIV